MYPFTRVHPYETQEIIINDILKHFREVSAEHRPIKHVCKRSFELLYLIGQNNPNLMSHT